MGHVVHGHGAQLLRKVVFLPHRIAKDYVADRNELVQRSGDIGACSWRLRVPLGRYTVRAGLGMRASTDSEIWVNDKRIELSCACEFHEVSATVQGQEITISGHPVNGLSYVHIHIWTEGVSEVLSSQAPLRPRSPPAFSETARGSPLYWNATRTATTAALSWGRKTKNRMAYQHDVHGAVSDVNTVLKFLEKRRGALGTPVRQALGTPVRQEGGWFSIPFLSYKGFETFEGDDEHQMYPTRAWHGCKFEALYSILYDGKLRESCDAARGEQFFPDAPGVYVHKDETRHKAENYIRFVPLCADGVFWAAKWEVRLGSAHQFKVPKKDTDQWIWKEAGVQLFALWICGKTFADLEPRDAVSTAWDPELEANPFRSR